MKEITFNNRNRERWIEYEKALSGKAALSPDQTGDMYIQVTDDLAFSKTFFPEGHTTRYLNSLASRFHLKVYAKKKEKGSKLLRFWAVDLRLLFYKTRKELILSCIIFLAALLIGILSATNDERFIRSVLGDEYVNMTLHNIATGNPLAVYQTMSEWEMFFSIAFNNIYVMFIVFLFGVILSLGTMFQLLRNGVMIGAFHTLFFQHGLLADSLLTVWLHGTIEIICLICAGMAGLRFGKGLLFPGTYLRKDSFVKNAGEGMKIILGIVPLIILAAFIESFITRHTDMPLLLNLIIILVSFAFMFFYLIIYPEILHNKTKSVNQFG